MSNIFQLSRAEEPPVEQQPSFNRSELDGNTSKPNEAIETNMTIGIDQLKSNQEFLSAHVLTFKAELYDPEKPTISGKAQEFLGRLAIKNPPSFANLTIGEKITDDIAEKFHLVEAIDAYAEFKKNKGHEEVEQEQTKAEAEQEFSDDDDDLPF